MIDNYPKEGRLITNYFFTDYVKKYVKKDKKGRNSFCRDEFRHVLKDIFVELGNEIVESDNGVHMHRMGYFYIFTSITPYFKSPKYAPKKIMYEYAETNGRRFYPCFNPTAHSILKGYSLDFNDVPTFRERIRNEAKKGRRWKFFLSAFIKKSGR